MGLAYVKALVRLLGGRIWRESELGVETTMNYPAASRGELQVNKTTQEKGG